MRVCLDGDGRLGFGLGGRGAWLCAASTLDCLDRAAGRGGFGRALRQTVTGDQIAELRGRVVAASSRGSDERRR